MHPVQDIPSDFIGSITSYHMPDGFVSTRVVLQPCVDFQDLVVYDDNGAATGNLCLDLSPAEGLRLPLRMCVHECDVTGRGSKIRGSSAYGHCGKRELRVKLFM